MESVYSCRLVKPEDSEQLRQIYAPYVEQTAISFEYEVPGVEAFRQKVESVSSFYAWVVVELNSEILGYAYASEFRSRPAYQWSPESTVYVKQGHHGKGLGKKLYLCLFELLKLQGFYNVFAGVALPNEESIKLHEKLGFRPLGLYKNIGYKFEKWHSTQWFQLELREFSGVPGKISKPSDLNIDHLQLILNRK